MIQSRFSVAKIAIYLTNAQRARVVNANVFYWSIPTIISRDMEKQKKASNAQMALSSFLKTFYYLGKSLDEVVRQYPYVVIIIIFVMNFIISTAMVMQARAERDDYNKQLYETEQKLHNYTVNKE